VPLIKVRGIEFFHREAGEGAPLLLIHGALGSADVWTTVFDLLARDHRVIAYDRRGYARTKAALAPPGEYFSTHGDDAAALMKALDAVPAAVLGWSGGALTALHLTTRHPGLVNCLVLEEAPFQLAANPTPEAAAALQRVAQLTGEGRGRDAAEAFLRFVFSYRTGGSAIEAFDPQFRESMLANAATLMPEIKAGSGETTIEQLQGITCPVTCLLGELSHERFATATDRLVEVISHARVVRIPGAPHAMHVDQPERFVEAVRAAIVARV
jgi:pimeloyl-ACP methyl ester carboxylesterase